MVFLSQTLHSIYERICSGSIFFVIVATPCFFLLFPLQGKSQDVQDYQRVRSFSFTDSTTHVGILLRREEEKSRILFEDGTDTTISHESILYAEILRRAPLVVRTDDSTEVTGTLDGVTDDQIRCKTGRREFRSVAISDINSFSLETPLDSAFVTTASRRIILSPTAVPLKKGEFEFSLIEVASPQLAYGITDHIALRGGAFVNSYDPTLWPLFLTAEGTLQKENLYFTAGAGSMVQSQVWRASVFGNPQIMPLFYGLLSSKSDKGMLSLGYYNVSEESTLGGYLSLVSFGGVLHTSKNFALTMENWVNLSGSKNDFLFSLGMQYKFGRRNVSFGLMLTTDSYFGSLLFPLLSVTL